MVFTRGTFEVFENFNAAALRQLSQSQIATNYRFSIVVK